MRIYHYYDIYTGANGIVETNDSIKSPAMSTGYDNPLGQPLDTYLFTQYEDESSSYGAYKLNIRDLYDNQNPIAGMKARCDITALELGENAGVYLSFIKLGLGELAVLIRKFGEHSITDKVPVIYINTKDRDDMNCGLFTISNVGKINDSRINAFIGQDLIKFCFAYSSGSSLNFSLMIGPSVNNRITVNKNEYTSSSNSIYISSTSVPFDGSTVTVGATTYLENALCVMTNMALISNPIVSLSALNSRVAVLEDEIDDLTEDVETVGEALKSTSKFFITR